MRPVSDSLDGVDEQLDDGGADPAGLEREGGDGRLGAGVDGGLAAADQQQVVGDAQAVAAGGGQQVGAVGVEEAVDGVGAVGAGQQAVGGDGAGARVVGGVGLVDRVLADPLAPAPGRRWWTAGCRCRWWCR